MKFRVMFCDRIKTFDAPEERIALVMMREELLSDLNTTPLEDLFISWEDDKLPTLEQRNRKEK